MYISELTTNDIIISWHSCSEVDVVPPHLRETLEDTIRTQ